jgi:hypothetical protein
MTTSNDVLMAANALTEGIQLVLRDGRFAEFVHLGGLALQLFTARQNFERAYPDNRAGDGFETIVGALATATAMVPGLDPVDGEVEQFARRVIEAIHLLACAVHLQPRIPAA